jgi:hypothetical protein
MPMQAITDIVDGGRPTQVGGWVGGCVCCAGAVPHSCTCQIHDSPATKLHLHHTLLSQLLYATLSTHVALPVAQRANQPL